MQVLLGITGGVAAYKSAALASALVQEGHLVDVVMTGAASRFVGPATFRALTGRHVAQDIFDSQFPLGAHIELAKRNDLFCIAPASANTLAKAATGMADDLLSTLMLSFSGPVLFAPAMNIDMWAKPSVQRNVDVLLKDGFHFIGPEEGWQSCRRKGKGRMAEPDEILQEITRLWSKQ